MKQKRLVTVQDISCFGKCSLTAAIPIISAFGIEAVALPTALLSTHTGGFEGYTFRSLSDDMIKITEHWERLGLHFDAMYSGYLGSAKQLEIVGGFFNRFKSRDSMVFVDPVMGDDGRLYAGFDKSFAAKMRSLCSIADIITPNVTEAALLTGTKYESEYDEQYIGEMAYKLAETGAKVIVITGISIGDMYGALCFNTENNTIRVCYRMKIDGQFYGTGDIFASTLCGALTVGMSLEKALKLAVDFVYQSILNTLDERDKYSYGVKFEQSLKMITNLM